MATLEQLAPAIKFVYPSQTKAVSVTGASCELNCAHCGGYYLRQMKPLAEINADADRSRSWLVSGGCRADGSVPLAEHLAALAALKQQRRFNLHVGLIGSDMVEQLAAIADCVSFDFVADNATISTVFGNGRTVSDYIACYQALRRKVKVVPHICIGLNGGEIGGEYQALELLQELGAESITFIVFTPTCGTQFAGKLPPDLNATVQLLTHARTIFSQIPLQLGCMRPGGRYREELDTRVVRIGLDVIVNPVPAAVRLAGQLGLTLLRGEECCSL